MISMRNKSFAVLSLALILLAACTPRPTPQPLKLVEFPGTPTPTCDRMEVLPQITSVQPDDLKAGVEVKVSARGGYFQDTCGAYDESARTYQIYVDDEPVADLQCYVNHCEGKFVLAQSVTPGVHCMGVQKGTCQVKLEVVGG